MNVTSSRLMIYVCMLLLLWSRIKSIWKVCRVCWVLLKWRIWVPYLSWFAGKVSWRMRILWRFWGRLSIISILLRKLLMMILKINLQDRIMPIFSAKNTKFSQILRTNLYSEQEQITKIHSHTPKLIQTQPIRSFRLSN